MRKFLSAIVLAVLLLIPGFVLAGQKGDVEEFFIDSSYDERQREQATGTLRAVSDKAYFYVEEKWYVNLTDGEKEEVKETLKRLTEEFDEEIYPTLTSVFGQEWKPGLDNDSHVTIFFHEMEDRAGGYFRNQDGYEKIRAPSSNEREMFYVSARFLHNELAEEYLAHEMVHLITFNQKERLRGAQEEIWLNESRADYAPILLGYDQPYLDSLLRQRVELFLDNPNDSLIEWQNKREDYGVINLFTHYLVEHYGSEVLVDSLHTDRVGIESLNYALEKNGFDKSFSDIFTDWTVAVFLNDCEVGEEYCYENEDLKGLSANPSLLFLPSTGRTEISTDYSIKPWSGHWYRIMGGEGNLSLKVEGAGQVEFEIPYVACENGDCSISFLEMNEEKQATTVIQEFEQYESLTLIPSVQTEVAMDDDFPSYDLSIEASMEMKSEQEKENEQLRRRIAKLQAKIDKLLTRLQELKGNDYACSQIDRSLKVGMRGEQVKCLQQFLKNQDDIYPEGLVTGYFGPLTKQAVIRFQERYQSEILAPWNLQKGTGYVGRTTKQQINKMIGK